jgi:hypothetical protein
MNKELVSNEVTITVITGEGLAGEIDKIIVEIENWKKTFRGLFSLIVINR